MERMLRRIAVRKDGTISMSEFRKFAEKYQGEIDNLEEENKKLKEEMKNRDKYRVEENKRLRKGIDIRLDSMGVKYIITEEGDYFTKSDFKITE